MDIPDTLLCLFSSRVEHRDDMYIMEVPEREFISGDLEENTTYRVAVLPSRTGENKPRRYQETGREPPVKKGDIRNVTIEGIGDQGDGIARVDRGYVVIVPDTEIGDEVEIEIEELHPNFAIGHVVDNDPIGL